MLGSANSLADARLSPQWRWGVPVLFLLAAVAALGVDCRLANWCAESRLPGDLAKLIGWSEGFGHGVGVLVVVLIIFVLDPDHRRMLPRLLAASWGAGLAANAVKMCVARLRPRGFDLSSGVLESFQGLFSLGAGGSGSQSFPSAHTATAVGLAVALSWMYPRGRWLFAGMAAMTACQRLHSGAHFLSDTLVGASVGWVVAMLLVPGYVRGGWFDRFEGRCRAGDALAPSNRQACRGS